MLRSNPALLRWINERSPTSFGLPWALRAAAGAWSGDGLAPGCVHIWDRCTESPGFAHIEPWPDDVTGRTLKPPSSRCFDGHRNSPFTSANFWSYHRCILLVKSADSLLLSVLSHPIPSCPIPPQRSSGGCRTQSTRCRATALSRAPCGSSVASHPPSHCLHYDRVSSQAAAFGHCQTAAVGAGGNTEMWTGAGLRLLLLFCLHLTPCVVSTAVDVSCRHQGGSWHRSCASLCLYLHAGWLHLTRNDCSTVQW